jgi:tRNA nucleotidyltransferase (CCA-adding enzyme)
MKTYLVGGAVRDEIIGRVVTERDWVVVGASVEHMLAQNFKPVGKDFPVFLHPDTHEEYALARTEKKVAKGYAGFAFYADPTVTLEQDLLRRDLTINAIAQDTDGALVDPYGGQDDIKHKILRHVSDAFAEDPVRILRIARFAARFPEFSIHDDTLALLKTMVNSGEVDALVPERVWAECQKALKENTPYRFFVELNACGASTHIMPELPLEAIDEQAFNRICTLSSDIATRFSVLTYTLNTEALTALCKRLKPQKAVSQLAHTVNVQHAIFKQESLSAEDMLTLFEKADAIRRPERFEAALLAMQAIHPKTQHRAALQKALTQCLQVDTQALQDQKLKGPDFANALRLLRIKAIL